MAKQIIIHSFDSESHLPNIGLDDGDLRVHVIQNRLKALDSRYCQGAHGHIRLLNDSSIDPTELFFAINTRIADAMTVHDPETADAATTRMPGIFPVHHDWAQVRTAWAESMLKIYMHYADSGGQTDAYRLMRDNAMYYLYPNEFAWVAEMFRKTAAAVLRTDHAILGIMNSMSERLGLRVLIARDNKTASRAFGEVGPDTVLVIIRGDKGPGGALNKYLKRGMPPAMIHDRKAFKVITDSEELAYKITSFLYGESIRKTASTCGSRDVYIHYPTDYIANPKPITGYQGLHVDTVISDGNLVSCESIICTLAHYLWADAGGASHAGYKAGDKDPKLVNGELKRFEQTRERVMRMAA
jgi:hypothetical protein